MRYVTVIPVISARSHPELNPKVTRCDIIKRYYELDKSNKIPSYFASFTELPKLGINPKPNFPTPIGVYCYPISILWDKTFDCYKPPIFTGNKEAKYIQIIKRKTNKILDVSCTNDDYEQTVDKLEKIFIQKLNNKKGLDFDDIMTKFLDQDYFAIGSLKLTIPCVKIYNLTYVFSKTLRQSSDSDYGYTTLWNKILRLLGFNAILDYTGLGFIYRAIKNQTVFLTPKSYEHIDTVLNKE